MNNFVLWALGVVEGYFGGILACLIWDIFTERRKKQQENREYQDAKKDFLMTQTERMKQKAEQHKQNESKQDK